MFRSMRFCYFLTNKYLNVGSVSLKNILHSSRINSVSLATCSVLVKGTGLSLDSIALETGVGKSSVIPSKSADYWSEVLTSNTDDIIWDEYFARPEVPSESGINTYALILLLCWKKHLHQHAISFFNYLWKKNEVTAGLLNLFCEFMIECPKNFRCCEDLIFKIFKNVIHTDKKSAAACSRALMKSPIYSNSVINYYKSCMADRKNHHSVIMTLIGENKFNEALELYINNNVRQLLTEKSLLLYMLQETFKGKETVPVICKFLNDICKMESEITISADYLAVLMDLFKKLKSMDQNYNWIVNKGVVNSNVCSFCKGELKTTSVKKNEIQKLLKDLEQSVIIQESIYMKSNVQEWTKFRDFIKEVQYNFVMDALNAKGIFRDHFRFEKLIDKITYHGLKPLVLARLHFAKTQEYQLLVNRFSVFLTDNLSDDDVFILYAALKKGKGCLTLSNDRMRFCNNLLSTGELLNIFKRWQATHQCRLSFRNLIEFPCNMLDGLQKSENNEEGEFRYHYICDNIVGRPSLICISRIKRDGNY